MEHILGENKHYIGVMIERHGFYVVVSHKDEGAKTVTYVTCPFPSCKLGFVDLLDKFLKLNNSKGVISYEAYDDLTVLTVDDTNIDMRKIVRQADWALKLTAFSHQKDLSDNLRRQMRQFVSATQQHWLTLDKYEMLNSNINEQH